jgi:hypothetical protein
VVTFKGKLFRMAKWFGILAFAFVLLICGGIGGLMVQNPVRAALWHCIHGNHMNIGDRQITLPLSWWRVEDTDFGSIVLRHAEIDSRIAFRMTDELNFTPQKPGRTIKDDQLAATIQRELAMKNRFISVEITAPVGKIFCVKSQSLPNWPFLTCFSSKIPWNMNFFHGPGDARETEAQAESILATLK